MKAESGRTEVCGLVDTSVVWLVSFGDLLTLLFCFFLVLTPHLGGVASNRSKKEGVSPSHRPQRQPGTLFASRALEAPGESRVRILVTVDKDRLPDRDARKQEAQAAFGLLGARKLEKGHPITVQVCEEDLSDENAKLLYMAARRELQSLVALEFEYAVSCGGVTDGVSPSRVVIGIIEFSQE
jgi:hypothetical protein